jgi:curved DNA-binding protein CbpA
LQPPQERFKTIARAYETLSDSKARKEHDEEIGVGDSLNMQTTFSFS